MNFKNTKLALLLGAINGILYCAAYEPVKQVYDKYENYRLIEQFNGFPPDIAQMIVITPLQKYLFWTLLFMLASYTVHRFWAAKIKSEIVLWQTVAIMALGSLSVWNYLSEKFSNLFRIIYSKYERGEQRYSKTRTR